MRNESQYARSACFPLYIFGISFIKWKWPAARQIWSKVSETFLGGYSVGIYPALGRWQERLLNFFDMWDTLIFNCAFWNLFIMIHIVINNRHICKTCTILLWYHYDHLTTHPGSDEFQHKHVTERKSLTLLWIFLYQKLCRSILF